VVPSHGSVREWLGAMVTAGIVEYDSGRGTYRLPPEHAAMVTRAAGPNNFACYAQLIPLCAGVEGELVRPPGHCDTSAPGRVPS